MLCIKWYTDWLIDWLIDWLTNQIITTVCRYNHLSRLLLLYVCIVENKVNNYWTCVFRGTVKNWNKEVKKRKVQSFFKEEETKKEHPLRYAVRFQWKFGGYLYADCIVRILIYYNVFSINSIDITSYIRIVEGFSDYWLLELVE